MRAPLCLTRAVICASVAALLAWPAATLQAACEQTEATLAQAIRDASGDSVESGDSAVLRRLSDVRLVHSPAPHQMQLSADESVLFSCSSSLRMWDTSNGDLLRSVSGPNRFFRFELIDGGKRMLTLDDPRFLEERGWFYGVPRAAPYLRLWDVVSARELAAVPVRMPVNNAGLGVNGFVVDEKLGRTFVLCCYLNADGSSESDILVHNLTELRQVDVFHLVKLNGGVHSPVVASQHGILVFFVSNEIVAIDATTGDERWRQTMIRDEITGIEDVQLIRWEKGLEPEGGERLLLVLSNKQSGQLFQVLDPATGKSVEMRRYESSQQNVSLSDSPLAVRRDQPQLLGFSRSRSQIWFIDLFYQGRELAVDLLPDLAPLALREHVQRDDYGMYPKALVWSPSARLAALSLEDDPRIYFYDLVQGTRIGEWRGMTSAAVAARDGKTVAAIEGNAVVMHDSKADSGRRLYGPGLALTCVGLSADGTLCAAGGRDRTVEVWDVADRRHLATLAGHQAEVVNVAIAPGNERVISCDNSGTISVWMLEKDGVEPAGPRRDVIRLHDRPYGFPLFQTGGVESDEILRRADGGGAPVPPMYALPADASWVAMFVPAENTIGRRETDIDPHLTVENPLEAVETLGDGTSLMDPRKKDLSGFIKVHRFSSGADQIINPHVSPETYLRSMVASPDGSQLALQLHDGQVWVIDLRDEPTLIAIVKTGRGRIRQLRLRAEDRLLLIGRPNGRIEIYSTESLKQMYSRDLPDCRITALDWFPVEAGFDVVIGTRDRGVLLHRTGSLDAK